MAVSIVIEIFFLTGRAWKFPDVSTGFQRKVYSDFIDVTLAYDSFPNCSSRKVEEDDFEDVTTNQKWVMSPKAHDTDVTQLLNQLLSEYDKKLRPDIGSEFFSFSFSTMEMNCSYVSCYRRFCCEFF